MYGINDKYYQNFFFCFAIQTSNSKAWHVDIQNIADIFLPAWSHGQALASGLKQQFVRLGMSMPSMSLFFCVCILR